MRALTLLYSAFLVLGLLGESHADEASDTLKMEESIKIISDPNADGKIKKYAMFALQELKDPRSIEALYENIDFVDRWRETPFQRSMRQSYPAIHALILIGKPSIKGAERYLQSEKSVSRLRLSLIVHVISQIYGATDEGSSDEKNPNPAEMRLAWLKKNYTMKQLEIVSKGYELPALKSYLKTLPKNSKNLPSETHDNPQIK
jgi:hypothetical protein